MVRYQTALALIGVTADNRLSLQRSMLGVDIKGGLPRIIAQRWNFGWLIGNQSLICTVDGGREPATHPLQIGR